MTRERALGHAGPRADEMATPWSRLLRPDAPYLTTETTNALSLRLSVPTTGNHTPFGLVHPAAAIFLLDLTSSAHNYG